MFLGVKTSPFGKQKDREADAGLSCLRFFLVNRLSTVKSRSVSVVLVASAGL